MPIHCWGVAVVAEAAADGRRNAAVVVESGKYDRVPSSSLARLRKHCSRELNSISEQENARANKSMTTVQNRSKRAAAAAEAEAAAAAEEA